MVSLYLTANFNAGALSAYVGGALTTLSNDLLNNPGKQVRQPEQEQCGGQYSEHPAR